MSWNRRRPAKAFCSDDRDCPHPCRGLPVEEVDRLDEILIGLVIQLFHRT